MQFSCCLYRAELHAEENRCCQSRTCLYRPLGGRLQEGQSRNSKSAAEDVMCLHATCCLAAPDALHMLSCPEVWHVSNFLMCIYEACVLCACSPFLQAPTSSVLASLNLWRAGRPGSQPPCQTSPMARSMLLARRYLLSQRHTL